MKRGIDLSYHQGDVDFSSVKNSGIDFLILREGYRNTVDSKFFEYVEGAKRAGIPILGVYHFSYALNEEEAKSEAHFCIENVKKAGLSKETIIFYDFEYDTVKKAETKGVRLTASDCNLHTKVFCEKVSASDFPSGVYCNMDYYRNWYRKETLDHRILWIADYSKGDPKVQCVFHQYSDKGFIPGISGAVDLNYYYGEDFKMNEHKERSRSKVVALAQSWIGKKESDGSYKSIIDIYNSFSGPFPRGIKMQYDWAWCACTWSALAIALGYTDIMPIEISCGDLIEQAKKMGCWQENDHFVPKPGDGILYDWQDNGVGDNTGWPDHVGAIELCNPNSAYMVVIEGNYQDSVKRRTISLNGRYIRGFITPAYTENLTIYHEPKEKSEETIAHEVIVGLWGDGNARREALESKGYVYENIQRKVNEILNIPSYADSPTIPSEVISTCYAKSRDESLAGTYVTTANLYCRNDAGTNKKALCKIPEGVEVHNYGYYTSYKGTKWLLIAFTLNQTKFVGFSSSNYLKKIR